MVNVTDTQSNKQKWKPILEFTLLYTRPTAPFKFGITMHPAGSLVNSAFCV